VLSQRYRKDIAAIDAVLRGNRDAFGDLVKRYLPAVRAIAYSYSTDPADAEDIVQETFLKAYASLDTLQRKASFALWIATITRNSARTLYTKNKRQKSIGTPHDMPGSTNPRHEKEEIYGMVRANLEQLDQPQREVLLLYYFNNASTTEVAKYLGISRSAVRKRLQRAREALGKKMLEVVGVHLEGATDQERSWKRIMGAVPLVHAGWEGTTAGASAKTVGLALGGVLVMKKLLIAAISIMVLGIGLYLATHPAHQDPPLRPVVRAMPPSPVETGDTLDSIDAQDRVNISNTASDEKMLVAFDGSSDPSEATGIWAVHGSVLDENGALVSGARVELRLLKWYEHRTGYDHVRTIPDRGLRWGRISDERGGFQFEHVPLGDYLVTAHTGSALGTVDAKVRERWTERVFVRLRYGGSIAGVVRTTGGELLPNARVTAFEYIPDAGDRVANSKRLPVSSVSTGVDGEFLIERLWPGAWRLRVDAPGYPVTVTDAIPVGTFDAQITVGAGARVEGTVILARTGEPVTDAVITLKPGVGSLEYSSASDEFGAFSLANLPAGEHSVRVRHHEWRLSEGPDKLVVSEGEEISGLRFALTEGGSVSGRIYDEQTGEGIAGVLVRAEPRSVAWGTAGRMSLPTDASGHYRIAGLEADSYRISFEEVAGYPYNRFERSFAKQVVAVGELESVSDIDFGLSKGARIAGTVVDERGHPVSGVIVEGRYRFYRGGLNPDEYAVSNEDGSFELFGFPVLTPQGQATANESEGLYLRARQRDGGRLSEELGPFLLEPEGLEGIQLHLSAAGTVSGWVVNEDGHAMAGAQVTAFSEHSYNFGYPSAVSDVNGAFSIGEVKPGGYSLRVRPAGIRNASPDLAWVDVEQGKSATNVRLVYDAGFSIQGIVTDTAGLPILEVQVTAHSLNFSGPGSFALTQRDGTFRIGGLAPGSYQMTIQHDAYARGQISSVPAGSADLHITLDSAAVLRGIVSEGGNPLEGVRIVVRTEEADRFLREIRTGEDGAFEMGSMGAGTMVVRAHFYFADSAAEHAEEQLAILEPGAVTEVYFSF
jgi:RNA polymerase sigma-70 factor (ECF subfamily)